MAGEFLQMRNKEMILTRFHKIGISLSREKINQMKYRNNVLVK